MPETRVDLGGIYALVGNVPPIRVDQGGIYALTEIAPPIRVGAGGMQALVAITPELPIAQGGMYVLASGSPCGSRWAQIWTIVRSDGLAFRFTSLDRDLEWPARSGIIYQACNSLVPSASEAMAQADESGSMDLSGGLGTITEHALYTGLFDDADVEAWVVPWAGEGMPRRLLKGHFGQTSQGETDFKVELLADGAKLMQTPLVETLQPGCRWRFGGPGCVKDLGPLTVAGIVDSGIGQRSFVDAARGEVAGYFSRGEVTFTSGDNTGLSAEIKEHAAGGSFTLWPRMPFAIATGDQYSMTPGCTLLKDSAGGTNGCSAWDNFDRYGGFLSVPTKDKLTAAAVTKDGSAGGLASLLG
jgi:uncharacterized phage protein (TIGR02218 family)